jgi:hypothetical protein
VGRTPWSAADAPVGLLGLDEADRFSAKRVQGVHPTNHARLRCTVKPSDIGVAPCKGVCADCQSARRFTNLPHTLKLTQVGALILILCADKEMEVY